MNVAVPFFIHRSKYSSINSHTFAISLPIPWVSLQALQTNDEEDVKQQREREHYSLFDNFSQCDRVSGFARSSLLMGVFILYVERHTVVRLRIHVWLYVYLFYDCWPNESGRSALCRQFRITTIRSCAGASVRHTVERLHSTTSSFFRLAFVVARCRANKNWIFFPHRVPHLNVFMYKCSRYSAIEYCLVCGIFSLRLHSPAKHRSRVHCTLNGSLY